MGIIEGSKVSKINRILISLAILLVDIFVFFLPLTTFFLIYILFFNPSWFRKILDSLDRQPDDIP